MLVAFIGQAVASKALPYSKVVCAHESMSAEMPMMSHHSMASDSNEAVMMDCCEEQCKCPMNGCVSLSLLVNNYFYSEIIAELKIFQPSPIHQSQANSSLYRPPIS